MANWHRYTTHRQRLCFLRLSSSDVAVRNQSSLMYLYLYVVQFPHTTTTKNCISLGWHVPCAPSRVKWRRYRISVNMYDDATSVFKWALHATWLRYVLRCACACVRVWITFRLVSNFIWLYLAVIWFQTKHEPPPPSIAVAGKIETFEVECRCHYMLNRYNTDRTSILFSPR